MGEFRINPSGTRDSSRGENVDTEKPLPASLRPRETAQETDEDLLKRYRAKKEELEKYLAENEERDPKLAQATRAQILNLLQKMKGLGAWKEDRGHRRARDERETFQKE